MTRSLDPKTGDLVLDGGRYRHGSPMTEVVVRVLRTPRGKYLPDPTFGVDYSILEKVRPDTGTAWCAAVRDALSRYTRRGRITNLRVTASVEGRVLRFALTFVDPLAQTREPITVPTFPLRLGA